jgi:hypothetical protein
MVGQKGRQLSAVSNQQSAIHHGEWEDTGVYLAEAQRRGETRDLRIRDLAVPRGTGGASGTRATSKNAYAVGSGL